MCLNSLPIADKISLDVRHEDGSLFGKEVPECMVTAMTMAGTLYQGCTILVLSTTHVVFLVLTKARRREDVVRVSKVQFGAMHSVEEAAPSSRSWSLARR